MWRQGEHVAIVGDTGSGKSFLETKLLPYRRAVVVLRTKSDPDIRFPGFRRIRRVREMDVHSERYVLEPRYQEQQREAFALFELAWREGGWCIAIDELYYAIHDLKLERPINRMLTQARSKHITMVCGMQRPVGITRFALAEAAHVVSFSLEGRDIKTLAEATTPRIAPVVEDLKLYQFAWFRRKPPKTIQVGTAQRLAEILR